MNPTFRSALIGIAAALAAYGGIVGVSHLAGQESGLATVSEVLDREGVTAVVTGGGTIVAPGAKYVTPRVAPVSPTVSPSLTPRISPTPWPSTPTPTPSTVATVSATPSPTPSASQTPSPTPWPSPTPSPAPTPTPTPDPTLTPTPTPTPEPEPEPQIIINEIAWAGTASSSADEWIELYNAGDADVDLTGWTLSAEDGTPSITFTEEDPVIGTHDHYLLERTDDTTVSDIAADTFYTGALGNGGEIMILRDAQGVERDRVNCSEGWFAGTTGSGEPAYATMERGSDGTWHNGGSIQIGQDVGGNPINGTPRSPNGPGQ